MRFRLSDESADAGGAIGDEEANEMSRKEPEDGELRVLVQVLAILPKSALYSAVRYPAFRCREHFMFRTTQSC